LKGLTRKQKVLSWIQNVAVSCLILAVLAGKNPALQRAFGLGVAACVVSWIVARIVIQD